MLYVSDTSACVGGCLLHLGGTGQPCNASTAAQAPDEPLAAHIFSLERGSWRQLELTAALAGGHMPVCRHSFGAVAHGARIVIAGGATPTGVLTDTWTLEVSTSADRIHAERHADMPGARTAHTLTSVPGKPGVMLAGGASDVAVRETSAACWLFDERANVWLEAAPLPEARAYHVAVSTQDELIVWAGLMAQVRARCHLVQTAQFLGFQYVSPALPASAEPNEHLPRWWASTDTSPIVVVRRRAADLDALMQTFGNTGADRSAHALAILQYESKAWTRVQRASAGEALSTPFGHAAALLKGSQGMTLYTWGGAESGKGRVSTESLNTCVLARSAPVSLRMVLSPAAWALAPLHVSQAAKAQACSSLCRLCCSAQSDSHHRATWAPASSFVSALQAASRTRCFVGERTQRSAGLGGRGELARSRGRPLRYVWHGSCAFRGACFRVQSTQRYVGRQWQQQQRVRILVPCKGLRSVRSCRGPVCFWQMACGWMPVAYCTVHSQHARVPSRDARHVTAEFDCGQSAHTGDVQWQLLQVSCLDADSHLGGQLAI